MNESNSFNAFSKPERFFIAPSVLMISMSFDFVPFPMFFIDLLRLSTLFCATFIPLLFVAPFIALAIFFMLFVLTPPNVFDKFCSFSIRLSSAESAFLASASTFNSKLSNSGILAPHTSKK